MASEGRERHQKKTKRKMKKKNHLRTTRVFRNSNIVCMQKHCEANATAKKLVPKSSARNNLIAEQHLWNGRTDESADVSFVFFLLLSLSRNKMTGVNACTLDLRDNTLKCIHAISSTIVHLFALSCQDHRSHFFIVVVVVFALKAKSFLAQVD